MPRGLVKAKTTSIKAAICSHPFAVIGSEPLRPKQRRQQIKEHRHANSQKYHVAEHRFRSLFQAVAGPHIGQRHRKKSDRDNDENYILHLALSYATTRF